MPRNARFDPIDDDRRGSRPRKRKKSVWRWILFIGGGTGLAFAIVVAGCVGISLWESRTNSDPTAVRAALTKITDMDIPKGLTPSSTTTNSRTLLLTARFESSTGASWLHVDTRPGQELKHEGTIQDSRDRGRVAGGGKPEQPLTTVTIPATVRGRPAEFVIRRYAKFEQLSGYFQGKEHAVSLEAEFATGEFPAGTAKTMVDSIRSRDGE